MKDYEPIKEYNENGVLVKEYIRKTIKINGTYYICIPIEFVKANKIDKSRKAVFRLTDRYDSLTIMPIKNEKNN